MKLSAHALRSLQELDEVGRKAVEQIVQSHIRACRLNGFQPENLERLRSRGLSAKRSLALREFALGVEGLERFVRGEPLRRVHECVFGVLALESEPVDPRL